MLLASVTGGVVLTACGGLGGAGSAQHACVYVARASTLSRRAAVSTPAERHRLQLKAAHQLDLAEPLAALAAGGNGSYEALQASLQEVGSVPLGAVMPNLRAECTNVSEGAGA